MQGAARHSVLGGQNPKATKEVLEAIGKTRVRVVVIDSAVAGGEVEFGAKDVVFFDEGTIAHVEKVMRAGVTDVFHVATELSYFF